MSKSCHYVLGGELDRDCSLEEAQQSCVLAKKNAVINTADGNSLTSLQPSAFILYIIVCSCVIGFA